LIETNALPLHQTAGDGPVTRRLVTLPETRQLMPAQALWSLLLLLLLLLRRRASV